MNERLLILLRRKEWLFRNAFEQATEKNKAAHEANPEKPAYPFSEDQMIEMELAMLDAQIELEKLAPSYPE